MNETVLFIGAASRKKNAISHSFEKIRYEVHHYEDCSKGIAAVKDRPLCLIVFDSCSENAQSVANSIMQIRMMTNAPIIAVVEYEMAKPVFTAGADVCLTTSVEQDYLLYQAEALIRRFLLYDRSDSEGRKTEVLRCHDLIIDPIKHQITKGGQEIHLEPREFRLLAYLAGHPGIIHRYSELQRVVWPKENNYDRDLTPLIAQIRRKLGDHKEAPRYIETVHKVGYRFIGMENPE